MSVRKVMIGLGATLGFVMGGGWIWLLSESALAGLGGGLIGGLYLGQRASQDFDDDD